MSSILPSRLRPFAPERSTIREAIKLQTAKTLVWLSSGPFDAVEQVNRHVHWHSFDGRDVADERGSRTRIKSCTSQGSSLFRHPTQRDQRQNVLRAEARSRLRKGFAGPRDQIDLRQHLGHLPRKIVRQRIAGPKTRKPDTRGGLHCFDKIVQNVSIRAPRMSSRGCGATVRDGTQSRFRRIRHSP